VRAYRPEELFLNYEFFGGCAKQIFEMFKHANFCKQTRLFTNFIYMLVKDLFKIYKVYYIHASEVLERFTDFTAEEA